MYFCEIKDSLIEHGQYNFFNEIKTIWSFNKFSRKTDIKINTCKAHTVRDKDVQYL